LFDQGGHDEEGDVKILKNEEADAKNGTTPEARKGIRVLADQLKKSDRIDFRGCVRRLHCLAVHFVNGRRFKCLVSAL
jgi:hypothetical protein